MADGGYRDDSATLRSRVEELETLLEAERQRNRGDARRDDGPATVCPACGIEVLDRSVDAIKDGEKTRSVVGRSPDSPLPWPKACTPLARVKIGWFRRCKETGGHFHESCVACGHRWLTAFVPRDC